MVNLLDILFTLLKTSLHTFQYTVVHCGDILVENAYKPLMKSTQNVFENDTTDLIASGRFAFKRWNNLSQH